ncbi:hypothetical protein FA95DRAFT_1558892 [Auriscalpium vulgare]|uniref:Uncharacterized protein n=1 Tax=Auriscalpium vulgare TaxID=40419 RepID=A0ACB8RVE9_9AGAM|nr:hypothetical protein FA95DRAFT_1558892 [Auriscalpium vulgare]
MQADSHNESLLPDAPLPHLSSSDFHDFALEISMATIALKGIRPVKPHSVARPPASLTVMQHLVSLLTTGTSKKLSPPERDIWASRVIATTAVTNSAGGLDGLVLADTQGWSEQSNTPKIKVEPLNSALTGEEILTAWRTRPREQHFQDVFTIIKNFQNGACPIDSATVGRFCAHYLKHCHPKIAGRMLSLYDKRNNLWREHPILVLEARLASTTPFTQAFPWTINVNSDPTFSKLSDCDIPRPSQGHTVAYTITEESLPRWIKAFAQTYRELERCLLDGSSFQDPPSDVNIAAAVPALECLRGFLQSDFLLHLFKDNALSLALEKPATRLSESALTSLFFDSGSGTPDASGEGDVDEADNVDPDDLQDPGESLGHHVNRFLKTITAPMTAIHILARTATPRRPITAHLVTLPQPVLSKAAFESKRTSFIDSVVALVRGTAQEQNNARGLLQKKLNLDHKLEDKPTVHAEAGMMALACAFCSPAAAADSRSQLHVEDDDNVLASIFTVSEAAIGVGKKCCYCCYELYEWLQKRKATGAEAAVPNFLLLGSHATIYPWYPPSFGIPIEFLRDLLADLKSKLAVAAKKPAGTAGSTQTSARSSPDLLFMAYDPDMDELL